MHKGIEILINSFITFAQAYYSKISYGKSLAIIIVHFFAKNLVVTVWANLKFATVKYFEDNFIARNLHINTKIFIFTMVKIAKLTSVIVNS